MIKLLFDGVFVRKYSIVLVAHRQVKLVSLSLVVSLEILSLLFMHIGGQRVPYLILNLLPLIEVLTLFFFVFLLASLTQVQHLDGLLKQVSLDLFV